MEVDNPMINYLACKTISEAILCDLFPREGTMRGMGMCCSHYFLINCTLYEESIDQKPTKPNYFLSHPSKLSQ